MVAADVYTDDPAVPLTQVGTEHYVVGTQLARWEDDDARATRYLVSCEGVSPTGLCAEYRQRSRHSEFLPGESDTWVRYRGTSETDARLPLVGDLHEVIAFSTGDPPEGQGPIETARFDWQTLPPQSGSTYTLHESITFSREIGGTATDGPDGEVDTPVTENLRHRLLVDTATRMPLRETVFKMTTGELISRRIWDYEPQRQPTSAYPANFFSLSRPASPDAESVVEYSDELPEGLQSSLRSSSSHRAMTLSPGVELDGNALCFAYAYTIRSTEKPLPNSASAPASFSADGLDAFSTYLNYYVSNRDGQCPSSGEPDVVVRSTATDGDSAAAWEQRYRDVGHPLPDSMAMRDLGSISGSGPTGTRAVTHFARLRPNKSGLYTRYGATTVLITGPLGLDNVPTMLASLEER